MKAPSADKIAAAREMRKLWNACISAEEFCARRTMTTEGALAIMDDAYQAQCAKCELLERQYRELWQECSDSDTSQGRFDLAARHAREREALND
jgi:hypothetical protein